MLLQGEKELADQLLELSKTARKQEATVLEQCKILHQMGELYLKDAIETGNGEQFVKASALINAALVRTEDPSDQKALQMILCDIYKGVTGNIKGATWEFSVEELVAKANNNKDYMHAIRVEVNEMCRHFEQLFDSYKISESDDKHFQILTEMTIVEEVKTVSLKVQNEMREFVKTLWEQATMMCSVPPPCQYAVIGLGSLARQETTPYSDLEFALLIERDSEDIKHYFKNLVYLFHLHILDLGETPIPVMAIESLNDFLSPDGDKLYDVITPCGFRLDGAMPWACKTPIGRKETPLRESLDLIKTPEDMASLLREDNVLGQAYRVADILCNCILICGALDIFDKYAALSKMILSKCDHKEKARQSLIEDSGRSPNWNIKSCSDYLLQSKKSFYRFPSSFVENLRIYFTPHYQPNSNWEVLEHLCEANILSEVGTCNLAIQLAICYGLRLLTYLKNRGQYENFRFKSKKDRFLDKVGTSDPLKAKSKCRVAYLGKQTVLEILVEGCYGLRYVVETYFTNKSNVVNDLTGEYFNAHSDGLVYDKYSWFRNEAIFGNLQWARSSKELSSNGCGSTCSVHRLSALSCIPSDDYPALLKATDEILNIKDCNCLSLLRTSLLVTKAILIKAYNLEGNVPKEVDIVELLENCRLKKYKNVRERFYLLLDLSNMSYWNPDKNLKVSIIKGINVFCDDIATFEESDKSKVNMVKSKLMEHLIGLYKMTWQFDKGVKLCQQLIDKNEMEFGVYGSTTLMGKLYLLMGDQKLQCGLSSEALEYYEKAFDILLNSYANSNFQLNSSPEAEESSRKGHMEGVRRVAHKTARLYVDHQRIEDAVTILTEVFTKDGKSYNIETDQEIAAMCLLSICCKEYFVGSEDGELYAQKGNQYFEEILEIIIAKRYRHRLHPYTVLELVTTIYVWIMHHLRGTSTEPTIANIYRKYGQENIEPLPKDEFLIKIMCTILDDKSLREYFFKEIHPTGVIYPLQGESEPSNTSWSEFFFAICKFFMHQDFETSLVLPQLVKFRTAVIQQSVVFCEKVVKRIASKTIHKMCLIYIDFHRIRMNLFDFIFTADPKHLESAKVLSMKTRSELPQYFPKCHLAQKLTSIDYLIVNVENWVRHHRDHVLAHLNI